MNRDDRVFSRVVISPDRFRTDSEEFTERIVEIFTRLNIYSNRSDLLLSTL